MGRRHKNVRYFHTTKKRKDESEDTIYTNLHIWLHSYLQKGEKTQQHLHWVEYMVHIRSLSLKKKRKKLQQLIRFAKNRNNSAILCMYGLQLFYQKKYSNSIQHLKAAYMLFPNSIILVAWSEANYLLKKYKLALHLMKPLINKQYDFFTKHLDSCCIEPFVSDLLHDVNVITEKCCMSLLQNKINIKYIKQAIIHQTALLEYDFKNNPK
eukprot:21425_1